MASHDAQVNQLHKLAQQAMSKGDLRTCHQHCLELLKVDPKHADAWFLCGVIAAHNGLVANAVEVIRNAITLAPQRSEYHAELGKYLLAEGELELALAAAEAALQLKPEAAAVLNTLATLLSHCGEHDRALTCFERANERVRAGQSPQDARWLADFYFNWGASQQFSGNFSGARDCLNKSIAYRPDYYRAHFALSHVEKQSPNSNHVAQLSGLQQSVNNPRDQLHIGHALAKEQEDLGLYDDALTSLSWAKSAQRDAVAYDFDHDCELFETIRSRFNTAWFSEAAADCDSQEPIFIVGMPRTGTTLLEQILASHSQVFAAGELQNFPIQLRRWAELDPGPLDAEAMSQAAELPVAGLGQRYLDSTRPRTGHTPHFIDKLPLNFLYLGLLHKALPNARVICLRRDPMDVCVSNYRQLFASNFSYYRYNLDLLECGRYYIEFDQLMGHWHQMMPGKILDLQYETLVADTEAQVRALLEFCNLPFEDACLNFHEKRTSVATPSAVQVRQKIYSSSINRWQRYGDAMQPLYELLKSAGFYTQDFSSNS